MANHCIIGADTKSNGSRYYKEGSSASISESTEGLRGRSSCSRDWQSQRSDWLIITFAKEVMFLPVFVCLSVC